ncbi:MAG: thioredoxin domain-containing protein, partial [Chloroflexota bacterium]
EAAARYRAAAERAADVVLGGLLGPDGRLGRSWKDGRATGQGVLEDYANLADGLLALYEATFEERWFITARALADAILERFADPDGGFFDTATDHERLVTRPKDIQDNATPSGGSVATLVLLRLGAFTGESRYRQAAERALATVSAYAAGYPTAFALWLQAIDLALAPVAEIAIVGDPEDEQTRGLLRVASGGYEPNRVVALMPDDTTPSAVPLLDARSRIKARPTAYVCRDFACRIPVTDPDALGDQLTEIAGVA